MKIGDQVESGIYAGTVNNHHIICSPIEYDLPYRVNWFQANEYCKSIGMELPTKEELNLLYELYKAHPEYFPKRSFRWYWSSTEISSAYAWNQSFYYGHQYNYDKTSSLIVRAVRRIKIES